MTNWIRFWKWDTVSGQVELDNQKRFMRIHNKINGPQSIIITAFVEQFLFGSII